MTKLEIVTNQCCTEPSLRREYFAFRFGNDYTCLRGFFPSNSCLNCGTANVAFGDFKQYLFDLLNIIIPWDGAMCQHDEG